MSVAPPRHLNLTGATNFRDLGGYPTREGRSVRWRQIFRSNHLGQLTEDDIAVLRDLGLKTAFDFRGVHERMPAMCNHEGITVHSLPVEPATLLTLRDALKKGDLTQEETREIMRESYRDYVRHNTASFRSLFSHLIEDHAPLVIHCTAGKDRTGFASALILHALGVDDGLILEDYLLTTQYYPPEKAAANYGLPDNVRTVIGMVHASYLEAAFDAVRAGYGDIDTYLTEGLGMGPRERAELRARYLNS